MEDKLGIDIFLSWLPSSDDEPVVVSKDGFTLFSLAGRNVSVTTHPYSGLVILTQAIPSCLVVGGHFYHLALVKLGKAAKDSSFIPQVLWPTCMMITVSAQAIAAVSGRLTFLCPDLFPIPFLVLTIINATIIVLLMRVRNRYPRWPQLALMTLYMVILGGLFYIRYLDESGASA